MKESNFGFVHPADEEKFKKIPEGEQKIAMGMLEKENPSGIVNEGEMTQSEIAFKERFLERMKDKEWDRIVSLTEKLILSESKKFTKKVNVDVGDYVVYSGKDADHAYNDELMRMEYIANNTMDELIEKSNDMPHLEDFRSLTRDNFKFYHQGFKEKEISYDYRGKTRPITVYTMHITAEFIPAEKGDW